MPSAPIIVYYLGDQFEPPPPFIGYRLLMGVGRILIFFLLDMLWKLSA